MTGLSAAWDTASSANFNSLPLFMLAVLVLNATPGVDLLLTITRTLKGGARAGIAAMLGINAGCLVHALAAAFGLAALLAVSATAFSVIKWLGAAYLLWLAVGMWRAAWRGRNAARATRATGAALAGEKAQSHSAWADFRLGLLTNVLNPKVALFFLAFLPQFIAPGAAHKTLVFLMLGAIFVVQSVLFMLIVVALVAKLRGLPSSPAATRVLQGVGGTLFAALALRLVNSRQAVP